MKEPYAGFLKAVVELVKKYGGIETAICTGLLHDTVEDCPPTGYGDIRRHFGAKIANSPTTNWSYERRTDYIRWA